ncbi:MAG: PAS domain S-box protein [Bacteroidota bacterium]
MTSLLPSDEVLRTLVEHATDILAVHDAEGRYVYISPAIAHTLGYAPDELLGQLPGEHIHPDDVARLNEVMATHFSAAAQQRPDVISHVRYRRRHKAGHHVWVSTSNRVIRDQHGQALFSVSAVRDVSELVAQEKVLAESEARWRSLVEHFPDPIVLSTFGSEILYINEAGVQLLGAPSAEAVYAHKTLHFLHPSHHATAAARLASLQRGEAVAPVLYQLVGFVSEARYAEFISVPTVYRGERVIQHIVRDVTEAKQDRTSLHRLAGRLGMLNSLQRRMLEGEPLRTAIRSTLHELSRLVPFERASVRLLNRTTQSTLLCSAYDVGGPDMPRPDELSLAELDMYLPDGRIRTRPLHVTHLRSNPRALPLHERLRSYGVGSFATLPLIARGVVQGTFNVSLMHEQGFSNEELDILYDLSDLLAIGIKQRELEQKRKEYEAELIEAREEALEMSRLKSTFLANMSHEIRTPLTAIIGFADILALNDGQTDNREFARLIRQSGQRLLDTLNSVLDLAQLEGDMVPIDWQWINVRDVAEGVAEMLRPRLVDQPVTLLVRPESDTPVPVFSDFGALQRILVNLASNAIKFTDEGEVCIEVDVTDAVLTLTVSDTGIGIPQHFLPHLFDEFRQASSGVSRDYEGSGLGLTITKRLVELLKGRIGVESVFGEGTRFTVTLPFGQYVPEDSPTDVLRETSVSYRPRLLVIAPDTPARARLSRQLHGSYEIDVIAQVDAALTLTNKHLYDLVLLDPDLDGEAVSAVRSQPDYATVPIIAWPSACNDDEHGTHRLAGFDGCLSADAQPTDVYAALVRVRLSAT